MATRFISWGMLLILVLLGLDIILVLLGGMRIEIGDFRIRSTTIEFPLITFLILIVFLFVVKGKRQEARSHLVCCCPSIVRDPRGRNPSTH